MLSGSLSGPISSVVLKAGLNTLGSNLTDREFEYILEKLKRSYDGKISLSEFEKIVNNENLKYENKEEIKMKTNLRLNPRYTKTYESSKIFGDGSSSEFNFAKNSATSKKEEMEWDRLQGLLREKSKTIFLAFHDIAASLAPPLPLPLPSSPSPSSFLLTDQKYKKIADNNNLIENHMTQRGRSRTHDPRLEVKRSLSLGGDRPNRRSDDLYSFGTVLGGQDKNTIGCGKGRERGGGPSTGSVIHDDNNICYKENSNISNSSSRHSNNNNSINNNHNKMDDVTSSGRQYGKERVEREKRQSLENLSSIPLNRVRYVLSNAGIQIGSEDASRLESKIREMLPTQHTNTFQCLNKKGLDSGFTEGQGVGQRQGQGQGQNGREGPVVSLDQFCDIVGISVHTDPYSSRKGIIFCHFVQYHVLFYCVLFCSFLLYSVLSYSIVVCSVLFYSTLFCSILFYCNLLYSILLQSVMFYSTTVCSILFYSILLQSVLFSQFH